MMVPVMLTVMRVHLHLISRMVGIISEFMRRIVMVFGLIMIFLMVVIIVR